MRKNFLDEVRETVSHDKPEKHVFASQDIAKECVFNVLELLYDTIQYNTLQYNVIQRTGLFWSP